MAKPSLLAFAPAALWNPHGWGYQCTMIRLQARPPRGHLLLRDVWAQSLEERYEKVQTALAATPSTGGAPTGVLFVLRPIIANLVDHLLRRVAAVKPLPYLDYAHAAVTAALLHPLWAHIVAWIGNGLPRPWFDDLRHQLVPNHFYVRSLEADVWRALLTHAADSLNLSARLHHRLSPTDPAVEPVSVRIQALLREEHKTEEGTRDKEAVHSSLRNELTRGLNQLGLRMLLGSITHYFVKIAIYPVETVFVRLTCEDQSSTRQYPRWTLAALHHIATEEGAASLYSGLSVHLASIIPALTYSWVAYLAARVAISVVSPVTIASALGLIPPELQLLEDDVEELDAEDE